VVTIESGPSANDFSMLKNVDIPILLPHVDGSYESIELFDLLKANLSGSRGWSDAIMDAFSSLKEWRMAK
jgi:mannosyl-3-phosphoglycerate phosphatase